MQAMGWRVNYTIFHAIVAITIVWVVLPIALFADTQASAITLNEGAFAQWLADFRVDAKKEGISENTLDVILPNLKPLVKVIELDRKQPEATKSFRQYVKGVVPKRRIVKGRELLQKHQAVLEAIGEKYGVQPRFIVALWGIETDFGQVTGNYSVPEVLATLAFEGRRHDFFRKELINSLKIIDEGAVKPKEMKGSWAGAMGQSQFMPSSFLNYAEDYNGDGKRDIWSTKEDVFASIANYLAKVGWDKEGTWGRQVKLPESFDTSLADPHAERSLAEWQQLGVRRIDGGDLPQKSLSASLVILGNEKTDAFLVYSNYKSILKWNRSLYFATAVGKLSDAIGKVR